MYRMWILVTPLTYTQVYQMCLKCVCPSGVALSWLAGHRPVPVCLRPPLPVREAHLDWRQQGARSEAAVRGARRSPSQNSRPGQQLRLQPASAQVRPRPVNADPWLWPIRESYLRVCCLYLCCVRELTAVLARLSQKVDLSEAELEADIRQLSFQVQRLENIQRRSKAFRSELGAGLMDCVMLS